MLLRPIFGEKFKTASPKEIECRSCEVHVVIRSEKRLNIRFWPKNQFQFRWRPFLFLFFFWRSPDFGRKKRLNFGRKKSQFRWRPFFLFIFLEITCFWAEKTFEFPILAEKLVSISVKTFFIFIFFLEITCFWAEKTFEFWAEKVSISVKTFFFIYFFGDHLFLGGKNVWISDFGRKISLNFGEDLFFFEDHLFLGGKNVWIFKLS